MASLNSDRQIGVSGEKYHCLFQFFPDAVCLTRAGDGTLLDVNEAFEQLTGCRREDLVGQRTAQLGCWHNPFLWEEASGTLDASGEVRDLETRLQRKDGRLASVLLTMRLLEIEGAPCCLAVIRDVTDRKRAEEKAREREEELRSRNIALARVLGERKRAEEALQVLAAEKSLILNSTSDLVVYHDRNMRILWVNRKACDSAVMQLEEMVGRHCWEIWHHRTEACSGCPVMAAFATGEPQEAEIVSPDGRQWHIRAFPVRDDDGNVRGVTEFCLDITERKRMERALRESEVNFAAVFRATPSVLVISTVAEGRYIEVNEAFEKVIGYRREEVIGRTSLELDIWEVPEARTRFIRLLREQGTVRDLEAGFRGKTGEIFVGLLSAEIIEIKGEKRLLILVNDISARKRAEEALAESEERYRTLFEGADDAILTIRDGLIVNCNNKALELFHSTPEEFIGKRPQQLSPLLQPDGTDSAAKALEKMGLVAAGFPQFFPWRHRRGDGTLFDAEVSLNRLEYQGKLELLAILRDVTERRKAEEQSRRFNEMLERRVAERTSELEEINRELESFCYTISHDLRAPLRAIDGFTHILREDHAANFDADGRHLCRRISDSAVRMGELIDDLLTFSRVGRAALQANHIEMTDLVRAVFDEVVPEEARRRIELRLAPLPSAIGDRAALRQVWTNLIDNAVKYSSIRHRQVIEIGGERTDTETVFKVRDNGIGFDMAYADKLFGVFQRLHGANEFCGTGVGLAVVGRIVQRHGGRVWAEGRDDRGAIFYFALPNGLAAEGEVLGGYT